VETGIPLLEKLKELGLPEVADSMEEPFDSLCRSLDFDSPIVAPPIRWRCPTASTHRQNQIMTLTFCYGCGKIQKSVS
jgi:hypothetical protein